MKFNYHILILISFLSNLLSCIALKHSDEPILSSTPKARNLRDHFGVSKFRNTYGPPPSLNLDNFLIHNSDLSWTKIPNPAFANELITPDGKKCDITRHAYYDICYAAPNCAECSVVESCGWCEQTQKCLPGNIDGCFCRDDCPKKWFQSRLQCSSADKVVLGEYTNISPFATKFIKPEMTGPKINMTVTKIEPGWEKIPMEYGTSVTRKNVTALNSAENRIVEAEINLSEKIIRDVPMPSLEVKKETKTYDLLTGKVIVSNTTSELHGIDTLIKK